MTPYNRAIQDCNKAAILLEEYLHIIETGKGNDCKDNITNFSEYPAIGAALQYIKVLIQ